VSSIKAKFKGPAITASHSDFIEVAAMMGVELAAFQAVVDVEARAKGFYDKAPVMLPEGHIAYARTSGEMRKRLVSKRLAWPNWGDRPYPKTMPERYARLEQYIEICGDKAYEFCSYGLPQMMGFNYEVCGFSSARDMFEAFKGSERAQLNAMARFIMANKRMLKALKGKDWKTFALLYNGKGYKKNRYDTKLGTAYLKRASGLAAGALDDGMLSIGDKGPEVEKLQRDLSKLGFGPLTADGDYGRMTAHAVAAFQTSAGLKADGIAGAKETLPAIERMLAQPAAPALPFVPQEAEGLAVAAVAEQDPPYDPYDMPDRTPPWKSGKLWSMVGEGASYVTGGTILGQLPPWAIMSIVGGVVVIAIGLVILFRKPIAGWIAARTA